MSMSQRTKLQWNGHLTLLPGLISEMKGFGFKGRQQRDESMESPMSEEKSVISRVQTGDRGAARIYGPT
jgi:hypothetical protein